MAKFKLDCRPQLRAAGNAIQDGNQDRILSAESVDGDDFAPAKRKPAPISRRKRVRVGEERVVLADIAGKPGIRSGAMLKDSKRRSNVKVGRVSVKVIPSADVRVRWMVFNKGDERQVARPFSGITPAVHEEASAAIAAAARDQAIAFLQRDRKVR